MTNEEAARHIEWMLTSCKLSCPSDTVALKVAIVSLRPRPETRRNPAVKPSVSVPSPTGYPYTSMDIANRYGVSPEMLKLWRRELGFPQGASILAAFGHRFWNPDAVDEWLRKRQAGKRGPKPRWLRVVNETMEGSNEA